LGGVPGDGDLAVRVAVGEGVVELVDVVGLEPVAAAAQQPTDPVERIALVAEVAGLFLLDAATDLVEGLEAELHDVNASMTWVAWGRAKRVEVAAERIQGGQPDPVSATRDREREATTRRRRRCVLRPRRAAGPGGRGFHPGFASASSPSSKV
jgi:hypothetical protein